MLLFEAKTYFVGGAIFCELLAGLLHGSCK